MSLSVFYYCICAFILCRCRSFNPSLCRLSPFLLPYVAVSRPCFACRNLAQQGLKNVVKTSGINGDLRKGGATQNTYCCMGPMGLKSKNENRECEKKTIPLMFCTRLISLHCQKNCVWTSLKCRASPPPDPWERVSHPAPFMLLP